jgi:cell division septation protein DedD
MPAAEPEPEPEIDPGIAALSALVARSPSVPAPNASTAPPLPDQQPSPPVPSPAPSPAPIAAPSVSGPYFTIQVGSFQDPANAASLARSLGTKGWEAFVVDWTNGSGQVWKVVRVGRYLTEAQAVAASTELSSAANLRGNVIKVR